jgi:hypothetical protein
MLFFVVGFLLIAIGLILIFVFPNDSNKGNASINDKEENEEIKDEHDDNVQYGDNQYDLNVKKNAYIDLASKSVEGIKMKVNMGTDFKFFDPEVLYLVPVGVNKCMNFDNGGQSPFGGEFEYFYVGVVYDGNGYDYYVLALDKSGMGIDFISYDSLFVNQEFNVKEKDKLSKFDFGNIYTSSDIKKYSSNVHEDYLSIDEVQGLSEILLMSDKENIIFVSNCKY